MVAAIFTIIVGIVLCVISFSVMRGNISLLHSYHRNRVKEEDIKPFGKLSGLGTLVVGIAVVVYGAFILLAMLTNNETYTLIGNIPLIVGLVVGMGIAFYAMKKYNGGIF